MKNKKTSNKATVIPSSIVLTEDQKRLPEVKALIKRLEEENKKKEIESKLTPIIEFAAKTLGVEFRTFDALAKYVGNKTESVSRAKRLSGEQKKMIDEMKADKKTHREIATLAKCKETQVNAYVYSKKK